MQLNSTLLFSPVEMRSQNQDQGSTQLQAEANTNTALTQSGILNVQSPPKKISTKVKCEYPLCPKRLPEIQAMFAKCACNKTFCQTHRFFRDHKYSFDYQAQARERVAKELARNQNGQKQDKGSEGHNSNHAF